MYQLFETNVTNIKWNTKNQFSRRHTCNEMITYLQPIGSVHSFSHYDRTIASLNINVLVAKQTQLTDQLNYRINSL